MEKVEYLNPTILIIILNINGINVPIKGRYWQTQLKKKRPKYIQPRLIGYRKI